jgi:hypothetical protein
MRIKGIAYLPEPEEYPQTWEVPDGPVPLRVEFNPVRIPIGTARLTKHPDGTITCTAQIAEGEEQFLGSFPKLAVSLALRPGAVEDRLTEHARVLGVSVCHENQNRDIPPYKILEDE